MSKAVGFIRQNDGEQLATSQVNEITPKCIFRLNLIRELAAEGLRITEIAERLSIPYNSVWRICLTHGVRLPERITHAKRISRQTMIELREKGWSQSQVQAHFGIDRNAMARLTRRYGLSGHWPGSHMTSAKSRLTPEQRAVGRIVANTLRQLQPPERARYRSLKDAGASVLQAFAQIARDRKAQGCALPPRQT